MNTRAVKRCPKCGRVRPAGEFYRRRNGRPSSYCRSCQRAAAHLARQRRRHDPATAEQLRAVDRARQRRHRALGGQDRRVSRLTTEVRLAVTAVGGGADTAPGVPGPYLVLDLGRGCDPHQACCRRCRWRSSWRATAAQAQAEHDRHQLATHGQGGRPDRSGRRRLVIRRRAR